VKKEHKAKFYAILSDINQVISPDEMSQGEAKSFLEELVSDLEILISAIREDMKDN